MLKKSDGILNSFLIWVKSTARLFLPQSCVCCGRSLLAFEKDICTVCLSELPLSFTWLSNSSQADKTFWGRGKTEKATSLFVYGGNYRKLLYVIKYGGRASLAVRLGKMLGKTISGKDIDLIVPVPLHPKKKRRRGYNQSELIGRGIMQILKKENPCIAIENRLLLRKDFTPTQTRKDRIDRWENVRQAFRINRKRADIIIRRKAADCSGMEEPVLHILLVDDVLTTGATLDACATILRSAINCRISIATLAYVP